MNDYRVHLGVDLVTKENAPVYAAADGKVSKIWEDPLMGCCIAIEHAGNYVTIYKNLNTELVTFCDTYVNLNCVTYVELGSSFL